MLQAVLSCKVVSWYHLPQSSKSCVMHDVQLIRVPLSLDVSDAPVLPSISRPEQSQRETPGVKRQER